MTLALFVVFVFFPILTVGNVNLSAGSTLCLAAASAGQVMANGGNIGTAIAAALGIALVIGIC